MHERSRSSKQIDTNVQQAYPTSSATSAIVESSPNMCLGSLKTTRNHVMGIDVARAIVGKASIQNGTDHGTLGGHRMMTLTLYKLCNNRLTFSIDDT